MTKRRTITVFLLMKENMSPEDGYGSFIGTWLDENGNVIYNISEGNNGNLRFQTWKSETWKVSIKNLRAEGGVISFDQYHFTPPSDKLKTHVSRDGQHPFSGIRCVTKLSMIDGDENAIQQTVSTPQLPEPITGILRRGN